MEMKIEDDGWEYDGSVWSGNGDEFDNGLGGFDDWLTGLGWNEDGEWVGYWNGDGAWVQEWDGGFGEENWDEGGVWEENWDEELDGGLDEELDEELGEEICDGEIGRNPIVCWDEEEMRFVVAVWNRKRWCRARQGN